MKQETRKKLDKLLNVVLGAIAAGVIVIVVGLALVGAVKAAVSTVDGVTEQPTTETAPGMPLDAIQYAAPTWMPDAKAVFEVTDRKNNVKWWVIRTQDQKWITLPIGEYQDAG